MEAKDPLVVDFFHGKYDGALDDWKRTDHGWKPMIRPIVGGIKAFLPFMFSRPQEFEWAINRDDNTFYAAAENKLYLIPSRDIQGLNYETTLWYKLVSDSEKQESKFKDKVEKLKKENGKLKRKLRQKGEEEEEQDKRKTKRQGTQGTRMMRCSQGHTIRSKKKVGDPCPKEECPGFLEGVIRR